MIGIREDLKQEKRKVLACMRIEDANKVYTIIMLCLVYESSALDIE